MTVQVAVDWRSIQDALYAWATEHSGNIPWIWAHQDAPQPPYPFGVLDIPSGGMPLGIDEQRFNAGSESTSVVGLRSFTLSLMVSVGQPAADNSPNEDARALLSVLQATLQLPRVLEQFRAANFSVTGTAMIQQFDQVVADAWISRSVMDLTCQTASCVVEAGSDWFDRVELSSDYPNADDSLDMVNVEIGG